jgi:hypothetical protein
MFLRRHGLCSSTGFFGVHARPYDTFAIEITVGGTRVWLGTFNTANEAIHAFETAAWRFGRGRATLNFPEIQSWKGAEFLSPPPLT